MRCFRMNPAGEDPIDFDADQGAMLVIPTAIRSRSGFDRELAERIKREAAQLAS